MKILEWGEEQKRNQELHEEKNQELDEEGQKKEQIKSEIFKNIE